MKTISDKSNFKGQYLFSLFINFFHRGPILSTLVGRIKIFVMQKCSSGRCRIRVIMFRSFKTFCACIEKYSKSNKGLMHKKLFVIVSSDGNIFYACPCRSNMMEKRVSGISIEEKYKKHKK